MLQWFISFSEFTEFSESSAPFRKNSNSFLPLHSIILVTLKFHDTGFHILSAVRECHITNFIFAVPLEMNKADEICNLEI